MRSDCGRILRSEEDVDLEENWDSVEPRVTSDLVEPDARFLRQLARTMSGVRAGQVELQTEWSSEGDSPLEFREKELELLETTFRRRFDGHEGEEEGLPSLLPATLVQCPDEAAVRETDRVQRHSQPGSAQVDALGQPLARGEPVGLERHVAGTWMERDGLGHERGPDPGEQPEGQDLPESVEPVPLAEETSRSRGVEDRVELDAADVDRCHGEPPVKR